MATRLDARDSVLCLPKIIKTRAHFPNDDAATKLLWLALQPSVCSVPPWLSKKLLWPLPLWLREKSLWPSVPLWPSRNLCGLCASVATQEISVASVPLWLREKSLWPSVPLWPSKKSL
jgi:hypothetical protein